MKIQIVCRLPVSGNEALVQHPFAGIAVITFAEASEFGIDRKANLNFLFLFRKIPESK